MDDQRPLANRYARQAFSLVDASGFQNGANLVLPDTWSEQYKCNQADGPRARSNSQVRWAASGAAMRLKDFSGRLGPYVSARGPRTIIRIRTIQGGSVSSNKFQNFKFFVAIVATAGLNVHSDNSRSVVSDCDGSSKR